MIHLIILEMTSIMAKINRVQNRQAKPTKTGFHRKKKVQRGQYVITDEYAIKAKKA